MGSKNKGHKAKNKNKNKPNPIDSINEIESGSASGGGGGKVIEDARFASVHSDPRFQKVPKRKTKVAIDFRFNGMFKDKRFASSSAPSDKRGKPKKGNSESSLRHYYHLEDEQGEEEKRKKAVPSKADGTDESDSSQMSEKDSDNESETEEEGSDSGSTTEEEDIGIDYEDGEPELQEENVTMIEKETRRLAVVNMDWRQVKAADLYVILSSFLPKDGQIVSVSVYPTDFGLQRMKEEEVHGPVGLFEGEKNDDSDEDDDEDDEIDTEKLRVYEKSRLSYYYAVVECDSITTADYLYAQCDGQEVARSSNVLDLRFIPDSFEIKHPPCDVVTEAPANYEGLNFQTQALQQSKINLTWDEDEPQRGKILKRKFNEEQLEELELKEYLASDDSESDDDENDDITNDQSNKKKKGRDKYLSLLQSGGGSDEDGEEDGQDMEVTFNTGLEDISKRILEKKDKQSESIWESYLRKRKEKKKVKKNKSKYSSDDEDDENDMEATEDADDFFVEEPSIKKTRRRNNLKQHEDTEKEDAASRAELELLLADDKGADTGLKGYNLKVKGKKHKAVLDEEKIPDVVDDPRFSALFTSPLYALDPTNPQFERSATYARQIAQKRGKKLRKGEQRELDAENTEIAPDEPVTKKGKQENSDILPSKEKQNLSSMVKSVKMKLKQVQLPSDRKVSKKSSKKDQHKVHSKKKARI